MKKIYISGQISGCPIDKAREKFERAEELIRQMGAEPVNPMKSGLPDFASWETHMALDIVLLMGCEGIYLLPDWENSRGATIEKKIAEYTGKQLIFEKIARNADIKQAVEEVTGLQFHDLTSRSRKTEIVLARMIYSKLSFETSRIKEIASDLNRSTSSVHYYLDQYQNEYQYSSKFRDLADKTRERLMEIKREAI